MNQVGGYIGVRREDTRSLKFNLNSYPEVKPLSPSMLEPCTLGQLISATGKGVEDEQIEGIIEGASHSIYMVSVLAKLKEIEFAVEEKGIAADIRTVLTSNFHDFHSPKQTESSVGQIHQSLNTGNLPHIIRGGWKGHAVYFVVQKGDDNTVKITICNRGQGVNNHHKVQDNKKKVDRSAPKEIEIQLDKLGEALNIIADTCLKKAEEGENLIYVQLTGLGTPSDLTSSAQKYQTVDNCDIVNLKQAVAVVCKLLYEEAGSNFYSKHLGRKALEDIDIDSNLFAMLQSSDSTEQKQAVGAVRNLRFNEDIKENLFVLNEGGCTKQELKNSGLDDNLIDVLIKQKVLKEDKDKVDYVKLESKWDQLNNKLSCISEEKKAKVLSILQQLYIFKDILDLYEQAKEKFPLN